MIYIFVGPPGCGKNTLARTMLKKDTNGVVLNRDDLRKMVSGGVLADYKLKNSENVARIGILRDLKVYLNQ